MKSIKFFVALFATAMMFSLVGCGEKEKDVDEPVVSIVGEWKGEMIVEEISNCTVPEFNGKDSSYMDGFINIFTFNSDGTGTSVSDEGDGEPLTMYFTYTLEGKKLIMNTEFYGMTDVQEYDVETLDANNLVISYSEIFEDTYEDENEVEIPYSGNDKLTFYYKR